MSESGKRRESRPGGQKSQKGQNLVKFGHLDMARKASKARGVFRPLAFLACAVSKTGRGDIGEQNERKGRL